MEREAASIKTDFFIEENSRKDFGMGKEKSTAGCIGFTRAYSKMDCSTDLEISIKKMDAFSEEEKNPFTKSEGSVSFLCSSRKRAFFSDSPVAFHKKGEQTSPCRKKL